MPTVGEPDAVWVVRNRPARAANRPGERVRRDRRRADRHTGEERRARRARRLDPDPEPRALEPEPGDDQGDDDPDGRGETEVGVETQEVNDSGIFGREQPERNAAPDRPRGERDDERLQLQARDQHAVRRAGGGLSATIATAQRSMPPPAGPELRRGERGRHADDAADREVDAAEQDHEHLPRRDEQQRQRRDGVESSAPRA